MELLTAPKSEYLLNGSVEMLHQQSNDWLIEIDFWRDEVAFFYALTVKKTLTGIPENLKVESEKIEVEIIKISGGELETLNDEVMKHEAFLSLMLDSKYEDEQKFRDKHKEIKTKVYEFEQRFRSLKKEVFKMVELLDEKLNDTLRNIYDRRSVRKYKDKPIDKKLIEKIIDAGRMAPSAINKQPWKFYVLTDKAEIKSFSKEISQAAEKFFFFNLSHGVNLFKTEDPIFYNAPVVIFLTSPKKDEWGILDVGLCAQNMMLAAKSVGLDSCPVGLAKFVEKTEVFPKLNIPETEQIALAIILGYGNETPQVHERIKDNVIYL